MKQVTILYICIFFKKTNNRIVTEYCRTYKITFYQMFSSEKCAKNIWCQNKRVKIKRKQ